MEEISADVDVPVYGLEALYKACYFFLDRAFIKLEGDPTGKVRARLRLKPSAKPETAEVLLGEFQNELLHQALRVKVASTNQKLRELIVTRALASAEGAQPAPAGPGAPRPSAPDVLDEDLEKEIEKLLAEVEREGGDDPLKIAVPWQEKSGASTAKGKKK